MYDDQNSAVESRKRIKKMHERTEQFVNLFFSDLNTPIKVNRKKN